MERYRLSRRSDLGVRYVNRFLSAREDDWYRFQARIGLPPEDMASGNPENPGFGRVTDPPSPLGFGRVIRQSLRLGETRRLVPVSSPNRASTERYGFRKILDDQGRRQAAKPRGQSYGIIFLNEKERKHQLESKKLAQRAKRAETQHDSCNVKERVWGSFWSPHGAKRREDPKTTHKSTLIRSVPTNKLPHWISFLNSEDLELPLGLNANCDAIGYTFLCPFSAGPDVNNRAKEIEAYNYVGASQLNEGNDQIPKQTKLQWQKLFSILIFDEPSDAGKCPTACGG
ncbi:hypothetical protein DdX_14260 [Ditylenchus destructor]|uniref:Uncharacterized protein n=1 Tax=Ditylenchus destructor TaxID=166010 RepID=A0AAD4MT05_9BILA|nr:hypothetical protein DdX_14260 [Ditylenchus destructor]